MRPTDAPAARAASADPAAVAAFLRALAERAERDQAFGREVAALLAQSGLLSAGRTAGGGRREPAAPLDPYRALRETGPDGLRARLEQLDAPALHRLIRAHRLDPARVSARWTRRERLVALIVEQLRGRADHGKAFARV
jgi:hypothetical protein